MISRREFLLTSLASGVGLAASSKRLSALEAQKFIELTETIAPSSSTYTRMFSDLPPQGANNPQLEEGLIALGEKMKSDPNEIPSRDKLPYLPYAGYTYLGQFIDHDLTFDIIPLRAANRHAEQRHNYRTPFLDLDQLYGGGPTLSPFLYRNNEHDTGKELFLIGKTISAARPPPTHTPATTAPPCDLEAQLGDDLPRNSEGIALVGDPRQDENLIIAQLHVVFLRVHNSVLKNLECGKLKSYGPDGATCFEQTRRLVTWHYQWIVLNEYLKNILDEQVYDEISKPDYRPMMGSVPGDFRIPIEFSGAAFRFGHSMVRDSYPINSIPPAEEHLNAELTKLLFLTGAKGGACPSLPSDWKVDWHHFFPIGGRAERSNPIDTQIASGLYDLSKETKELFAATMPNESVNCNFPKPTPGENDLPVINLLRGARMELPSGQAIAKALGVRNSLTDEEIVKDSSHEETLKKYGLDKDTPLWYYILKEAELRGKGYRLGVVGSKIVGDVIISALLKDPESYLSVERQRRRDRETTEPWSPILPVCKDKPEFDMSYLIRFARNPDWKKICDC